MRIAAALIATALLLYGGLLDGGLAHSVHSDFPTHHFAAKTCLWNSLQAGHGVPFWRQDELSGSPGLTHPQALLTHPLHFLFFLMPPEQAIGPTLWVLFVGVALATSEMGRTLGFSGPVRYLLGVFALTNHQLLALTYAGWLPVLTGLVCLPLFPVVSAYAVRRPGLRAVLATASLGTLALHGGHLQLPFYQFLLMAVVLVAMSARRQIERPQATWLSLLSGALLAIAVCAYLLVPLAAESALSSRKNLTYELFLGEPGHAAERLLSLIRPPAISDEFWERDCHFGLLPLLFAVAALGLARGPHRKAIMTLAGLALTSLLLSHDSPILQGLYEFLPGFRLFRLPARFLLLTPVFVFGLAGFTAQALERRKGWAPLLGIAILCCLQARWDAGRLLGLATFPGAPRLVGIPLLPAQNRYAAFFREQSQRAPLRIAPIGRSTMNYGWGAAYGMDLITGYEPYNYAHYQAYLNLLRGDDPAQIAPAVWSDVDRIARPDLLAGLNVRYLMLPQPIPQPPPWLTLAATFPDQMAFRYYRGLQPATLFIYENRLARARVWAARQLLGAPSWPRTLELLSSPLPPDAAVVSGPQPAPPGSQLPQLECQQPRPDQLLVSSRGAEPALIVVSEIWHPGWSARVDGQLAPIYRVNAALMGLALPPGDHRIELLFRPLYWSVVAPLSLSACAVLLLLGLVALRRDPWTGSNSSPG